MPAVDASVTVKWFVEEPGSASARALRAAHIHGELQLIAPELLVYEVTNVLLRHPRFEPSEIDQAIDALYDLQLELIVPTADVVHAALRLAIRYRLTFYDALYVALAQQLDMDLITADRRLHDRVSALPFVHLLSP